MTFLGEGICLLIHPHEGILARFSECGPSAAQRDVNVLVSCLCEVLVTQYTDLFECFALTPTLSQVHMF